MRPSCFVLYFIEFLHKSLYRTAGTHLLFSFECKMLFCQDSGSIVSVKNVIFVHQLFHDLTPDKMECLGTRISTGFVFNGQIKGIHSATVFRETVSTGIFELKPQTIFTAL
jgi:hypothetical protein